MNTKSCHSVLHGGKAILAVLSAAAILLTGCGKGAESFKPGDPENNKNIKEADVKMEKMFEAPKAGDKIAVMHTTMGDIKIKFFPEDAPKSVENFLTLSERGYYNDTKFHRVIKDFMIQSGDPTGVGQSTSIYTDGRGRPVAFEDEFSLDLWNFRGALSMANAGPNTNTSQFFIVQAQDVDPQLVAQMRQLNWPEKVISKYEEIGGTPWLDGKHSVFGYVMEGMDVVDAIASVKVDGTDKPLEDVLIKTIDVITVE